MQAVIKLISTHRLDPEKGWDLIVAWLQKILSDPDLDCDIQYDIYGDGKMKQEIVALAQSYPNHIRYHGFVPIHTIFSGPMDYDFVLMPSRFLETFGLSALDFAQFGIPTIGFQKGGLRQFVSDKLDIAKAPGANIQEQFNNLMAGLLLQISCDPHTFSQYRLDSKSIKYNYSSEYWLDTFKELVTS